MHLVADVGRADALVRAGCYRCLEEAYAIYERASASPGAPASAFFEVRREVESRAGDPTKAAVLLTRRARRQGFTR